VAAPKKYPDELKARAVRLYLESDPKPTIRKLAQQLGVHHEALRNWIRQADTGRRTDPAATDLAVWPSRQPSLAGRPGTAEATGRGRTRVLGRLYRHLRRDLPDRGQEVSPGFSRPRALTLGPWLWPTPRSRPCAAE